MVSAAPAVAWSPHEDGAAALSPLTGEESERTKWEVARFVLVLKLDCRTFTFKPLPNEFTQTWLRQSPTGKWQKLHCMRVALFLSFFSFFGTSLVPLNYLCTAGFMLWHKNSDLMQVQKKASCTAQNSKMFVFVNRALFASHLKLIFSFIFFNQFSEVRFFAHFIKIWVEKYWMMFILLFFF